MDMHARIQGPDQAPVVFFLHGFMGSSADWDSVVSTLSCSWRCVALDLPGHGATGRVDADEAYSVVGVTGRVLVTMDRLGLDQVHLVGYSMGARLALHLALHHPERFHCVVMESGSPGLLREADRAARAKADDVWAVRLMSEPLDQVIASWYNQPLFATLREHPEVFARMCDRRRQNDPTELARSMRGMSVGRQPSHWDDLSSLRTALHVVVGALDRKYGLIADYMQERNRAIQVHRIAEAGHNAHCEKPDAFAACLEDILTNHT